MKSGKRKCGGQGRGVRELKSSARVVQTMFVSVPDLSFSAAVGTTVQPPTVEVGV